MPNIPRLPLEIIDLIVSSIPRDHERSTTLVACNSLSVLWHAAASPHIFRSIHIGKEYRANEFVALITLYPEIAFFVRKLVAANTVQTLLWVKRPRLRFPNMKKLVLITIFMFESSHAMPTNLLSAEALPSLTSLSISHTHIPEFRHVHGTLSNSRVSRLYIGFLGTSSGLGASSCPSSLIPTGPPESLTEICLESIENQTMHDQICSWLTLSPNIRQVELLDLRTHSVGGVSELFGAISTTLQHLDIVCGNSYGDQNERESSMIFRGHNSLTQQLLCLVTLSQLPIHLLNNLVSLTFALFRGFRLKLPDKPRSLVLIRLKTLSMATQVEFDNAVREVKERLHSLPSLQFVQRISRGTVILELNRAALE